MRSFPLIQPETQFGTYVAGMLTAEREYSSIIFISAFVALRTILRLREALLDQKSKGCHLKFVVGIDLRGTSKEVLEELLRWECESAIVHNASPRVTFHPKVYVFESNSFASIVVGSNNLTDGGFYTNYEAAVCHEFVLPADRAEYERHMHLLSTLFAPSGSQLIQELSDELVEALVARGQVPTESEARAHRSKHRPSVGAKSSAVPPNPFGALSPKMPPLLAKAVRPEDVARKKVSRRSGVATSAPRPEGVLVWRKKLPRTDALQTREGSHHVGGVRLTQAKFEDAPGHVIDQTTYFRKLFSDFAWEQERGGYADQERTFIPMRVFIRGRDYGIRIFEISHKPSGEAEQANYTTILRWGGDFTPTVAKLNLTGSTLSLYETEDDKVPFLVEIA